MRRTRAVLYGVIVTAAACSVGGCPPVDGGAGGGTTNSTGARDGGTPPGSDAGAGAGQGCTTLSGNIEGVEATANISLEQLPCSGCTDPTATYLLMAGEIDSGAYRYSFTADVYGTSGYGDMLSITENQRFRIRIDLAQNGFYLTANPFEGTNTTTYTFACR